MTFAVSPILVGVIAALSVAAIVATAAYFYFRAESSKIPFKPLPGPYVQAMYLAPYGVEPERILAALQNAASALAQETKWDHVQINAAFQSIRVFVAMSESWVDSWGRTVGGTQQGYVVAVGRSLTALCHECAHYLEWKLDGEIDTEHASWGADGIWDADVAYRRWLSAP